MQAKDIYRRTGFDEMFGLKQDWAEDIEELVGAQLPNLMQLTKKELMLLQDALAKATKS